MEYTALVTGAKKRIGQRISEHLKKRNIKVITHARKKEDNCDLYGDLENPKDLNRIIDEMQQVKSWNMLINNASFFSYDSLATASLELIEKNLKINLLAPLMLGQALNKRKKEGLIIHMLDAKLKSPNPDFFSYTLSKLALQQALELESRSYAPLVRVNGIAPGLVLKSGKQSDQSFAKAHAMNPLQKKVGIADLLKAMDFLIDVPTVTNQIMTVDAGYHLMHLESEIAFLKLQS